MTSDWEAMPPLGGGFAAWGIVRDVRAKAEDEGVKAKWAVDERAAFASHVSRRAMPRCL